MNGDHQHIPASSDSPATQPTGSKLGRLGKVVSRRLKRAALPRLRKSKPGTPPGLEVDQLAALSTPGGKTYVSCVDYSPQQVQMVDVADIDRFAEEHRPPWTAVRWIDVDGLGDMHTIELLARKYQLHPLAIEDLLQVPQRPKLDDYSGGPDQPARLFLVTRMLQLQQGHIRSEQVSIFIGHRTVLTFQETRGDVWGPIRQRLITDGTRLRMGDASFLVYSLLDAMIDHCFPILDHFGDRLEELEETIVNNVRPELIHDIHTVKRELMLLRRQITPMRDVVLAMQREPHECISETTRVYLRDVHDHVVQAVDLLDTYRDLAMGLADMYHSGVANRVNDVMKVLTVIATIFMPISFLTGVFGMNFDYMPGLHWYGAFGVFLGACFLSVGSMLLFFKLRGWL